MKRLEQIKYIITSNSITLYWEKPLACDSGLVYQVWLNGQVAGETDKTHFELIDLEPKQDYEVLLIGMIRAQCEEVACKESECERTGCKNAASQNAGICENRRLESDLLKLRTKAAKKRLDVTKAPYNAVGDGKTMNTRRLQQALDDCREDEEVYLPRGSYLTGALRLHSNTELYLEEGAVLQGTDVVADYLPKIKSRFEGIENESYSSLLNMGELDHEGGYSCQNVVIRGKGTIASGGRILAERVIALETEYLKDYLAELGDRIKECEKPETIPGRVRPRLIQMSNCQNVVISGITLKNGASWNVHMIYSDNIVTNNCTFISENVWNGDGWDPDSSTNCTLFGCTFYTGDDSVAIKSGKNPEGNLINRPTKHIRIFDCKCALGHGIAVGSEMSGGIEDVKIWDCDMRNSLCGIEIKGTGKRGGYVRDIQVRDCKVSRIMFHSVAYNDDGIGAKKPPVFENCIFEGLQITGSCYDNHTKERRTCDVIELCGFEKPGHELKNIVFREISLGEKGQRSKQTISLGVCEDITFEKIRTMN